MASPAWQIILQGALSGNEDRCITVLPSTTLDELRAQVERELVPDENVLVRLMHGECILSGSSTLESSDLCDEARVLVVKLPICQTAAIIRKQLERLSGIEDRILGNVQANMQLCEGETVDEHAARLQRMAGSIRGLKQMLAEARGENHQTLTSNVELDLAEILADLVRGLPEQFVQVRQHFLQTITNFSTQEYSERLTEKSKMLHTIHEQILKTAMAATRGDGDDVDDMKELDNELFGLLANSTMFEDFKHALQECFGIV